MLGLASGGNMRGLNEFISDIRACKDKESEQKRVEVELAKIRERFTTQKGLNAYQRKKYVWKLLYIHILGYEVDFGLHEAAGLINSAKYDEKYTGYVAASILISQKNEQVWKSIVHSIQSDLRSRNEPAQSLAFSMIGTIAPDSLVNTVQNTIIDVALTNKVSINVRRKAVLCLSRILKKFKSKYEQKKFIGPVCEMIEKRDAPLSFLNSAASLLLTCQTVFNPEHFRDAQPKVVQLLHKLAINKECSTDYLYFTVPNPWLQMKLYKALQLWAPPQEKGVLNLVEEILTKVLKRTDASKSINRNNAEYGLLFEAINVIIHYDQKLGGKLMEDVSKILAVFISSSQANIRYLGLESMCRLAFRHDLSKHESKILANLEDADISIRRRSLDLLYLICKNQNASGIVAQLLGYLQNRNDPLIKDDLVLKIAILAEKFAENLRWYVDVVIQLMKNAEVQNDIWYRIVQIITGFVNHNVELQNYAAQRMYMSLSLPHITDTLKCVGSYIVAQFSQRIVKTEKDPRKLFDTINKHFQYCGNKSKAIMLNAFVKLASKYPQLKQDVQMICHLSSGHWDPDVQQRGVQYLALLQNNQDVQRRILSLNPAFTEEQQNSNPLLRKFAKGAKKPAESANNPTKSTLKSFENVTQAQTPATTANQISHPLSAHPLFKLALDRLCKNNVNLLELPGKIELKPYWKQAFVKKTSFEGIEIKQKVEETTMKAILSIGIKTAEMQFKVFSSKGFDVTSSPVKYGPEVQQIMLTITPNGEKSEPPVVGIAWKNDSGTIEKKQVQLPIAITKFLVPVEISLQKFREFYNDYSLPNEKFHKLDAFLKIPEGVKGSDFLKKLGQCMSSVCQFKCNAHPSFDNIQQIYGGAKIVLKEGEKNVTVPIIFEAEAYSADKVSAARVSMRGGRANIISSIYQIVLTFLG